MHQIKIFQLWETGEFQINNWLDGVQVVRIFEMGGNRIVVHYKV